MEMSSLFIGNYNVFKSILVCTKKINKMVFSASVTVLILLEHIEVNSIWMMLIFMVAVTGYVFIEFL